MGRLRVAHLRMLVPFVVVAWRASQPIGDNSFLWHVRAGTAQIDSGKVLSADPFSFTEAGASWRTQSWLADIGYGWLESFTGGLGWVPAMKFVALSLLLALLGLVIHRVVGGHNGIVLGGIFVVLWAAIPFGVARPALLGFVLLGTVVAITHMRQRPLWALPVLFWLWASIHGMFAIGLGYLVLDGIRRRSRRQLVATAISALATAATAHGLGTWWVLVQFLRSRGALDLISEWGPPDFSDVFTLPFLIVIVGLLVAGVRGQMGTGHLWIAVPFLSFGLLADRNVLPALIVLAPLAMLSMRGIEPRTRTGGHESPALNWAFAVVLVAGAILGLAREAALHEARFPSRDAIAALDEGPAFNGSAVGGYLIYAEWPTRTVFIDDRAELYGESGFRRFIELRNGVDVAETFGGLGIKQAIVASDWPIVDVLERMGWALRYEDDHFVVIAGAS